MSEAPAEMWLRQRPAPGHGWYQTALAPLEGSGVVRYVRADLYEALRAPAAKGEFDAVTRTKADPNRSRREDQLVAEIERLEALVSGLQARLAVVRSWNEAPCLEPLGTDYPR